MGWEELLRGFFGGGKEGIYELFDLLSIKIPTIKMFVKMASIIKDLRGLLNY